MPDNADEFQLTKYDYIVDAVDTVTAKLELITRAKSAGVPIISCMGAGNKLDPTMLEVADIYKTSMDPLAKVMRTELKKRGIKSLKVVYSKEKPIKPIADNEISCKYNCICPPGTVRKCADRRSVPGSVSFVPSVAGLIIAGETVKDLIAK
jgi:tRNA A37 threonylcarbamoyladenosine dehydratase